jgi:endonuclease-3 related protein
MRLTELRHKLLSIWGIGPETADSILCYALDKLSFVVDAYTIRIFHRLGVLHTKDYHQVKAFFEKNLPKSIHIYNEYHALIVALGKDICRPKPKCELCPLNLKCEYNK